MTDERYNGWKNYETWCVSLWIENEEPSYLYSRELVAGKDKGDAAQALKEWITEASPLTDATLYTDLLNAALSEVDWYEIAEAYQEE